MNVWLLSAGSLAAIVTAMHIFGGGPAVARPLLQAKDIEPTAKYVNYYCWHLVTINLVVMSALFSWSAFSNKTIELAIAGSVLAALYALWGTILPRIVGQSYLQMPQGWFFVPIAVTGFMGVFY